MSLSSFSAGSFARPDFCLKGADGAYGETGRAQKLTGPAILEQRDSTVWVLPDWAAEIDRIGNIGITAPNGTK